MFEGFHTLTKCCKHGSWDLAARLTEGGEPLHCAEFVIMTVKQKRQRQRQRQSWDLAARQTEGGEISFCTHLLTDPMIMTLENKDNDNNKDIFGTWQHTFPVRRLLSIL